MDHESKVVAIIQARQGSTRLPGKVMKEVLSQPLLKYLIDRVLRAKTINQVVVATTCNENDDLIAAFCKERSISCYRGDTHDVLGRYYAAAQKYSADHIVRITADCPLIDPDIIDKVVSHYLSSSQRLDYVSNTLQRTYPRGMDVEVFSYEALKIAAERAVLDSDREHVTSFIYSHPDLFKLENINNTNDDSVFRWTVDTSEDFQLVKNLIEEVYPKNKFFTYNDLINAMRNHPNWFSINAHIEHKKI